MNQKDVLGSIDKSGSAHKIKSVYRPAHCEIEKKTLSLVPCQALEIVICFLLVFYILKPIWNG